LSTVSDRPGFVGRVGRGFLWNFGSRLLEFVLRFVLFAMLARGLGKAGYGGYAYVMSIFGIASLVAGLGLEQTLNTFTAEWRARQSPAGRLQSTKRLNRQDAKNAKI
jgi:O-antigen/teichoic acid export membrane protein